MRNSGTYGKGPKGKADRYFSLIVRNEGRCRACGDSDYRKLQCAHIKSRTYSVTRCDFDNAVPLCWSCHRRFTDNPFLWVEWVYEHIGRDEYERIDAKAKAGVGTKVDWEQVAADLKARCDQLGIDTTGRRAA